MAWIFTTDGDRTAGVVRLARSAADEVVVVAVGPREVADAAAAAGPDRVLWAATAAGQPAEALAGQIAARAAAAAPRLLLAAGSPAARALLGAAAAAIGAAAVSGVVALRADGDRLVVDRLAEGGAVLATSSTAGPLAAQVVVDDEPATGDPAPVELLPEDAAADLRVTDRREVAAGSGLHSAARVVSVGRGLRSRDDLALVEKLAGALGAEIACTMPVADDLGWVPKERYVGRSGQKIAPRLYLALGVSGMPQHLDGVRDAKVIAAVNTDPDAPIFRAAGYGIVGDLYEVVPALVDALAD